MTPDAETIEAIKAGDRERYAELVERYQRMVYGIAWSRLGDADLCEDAAQETFLKAYRYLVALRNPAKFPMWLARIARNVSTSLLRQRRRELDKRQRWQMEPTMAAVAEQPLKRSPPLKQTLARTLENLSEQHRECLVLFYMEGKSVCEAAEVLGISEAALKTRLHRARKALRGQLEEALESSLTGLGPRAGFSAGVMPLLPTLPFAAAVGTGVSGAKALGLFGKSLWPLALPLWIFLANVGSAVLFHGWLGRLEAANLVPGPTHSIRRRLIRGNVVALVIVTGLAFATSISVSGRFGPLALYRFLTIFCLWGTWSAARMLRVNRSPYTVGVVLSNVAFLLASFLIGFCNAPFVTFFAVLLVLNVILYHTNKSRPMRHDYNLFLRQAKGLLGTPTSLDCPAVGRLTQTEMQGFVRFLGARYLVNAYSLNGTGLRLSLPPVKPGLAQFLSYTMSNSSVFVDFEWNVHARLGGRDARALHELLEGGDLLVSVLEESVSQVVGSALQCFLAGQREEAATLLQVETDAQVFQQPTAQSREHRIRGMVAIAVTIPMLVGVLLFGSNGVWNYQSPKPVTVEMAREAFSSWCANAPEAQRDLLPLLNAELLPPADFLGAENGEAYKKILVDELTKDDGGDVRQRVYRNLGRPKLLYHVLDKGLLTRQELADLGLSPGSVRAVLEDGGREKLREMDEASMGRAVFDEGAYTMWIVDENARRLACLKSLGCLDFVDDERIAAEIAVRQVTADWQTPEGYREVPVEKAAGLFHFGLCDLRATRGALWSLQLLGKLDLIDREACVEGLLRFYHGRGIFKADFRKDHIQIYGNQDDTFYALESLAILDALGEIPDPWRWNYKAKTSSRKVDGEMVWRVVTADAFVSWAYQLRLEELLGREPSYCP